MPLVKLPRLVSAGSVRITPALLCASTDHNPKANLQARHREACTRRRPYGFSGVTNRPRCLSRWSRPAQGARKASCRHGQGVELTGDASAKYAQRAQQMSHAEQPSVAMYSTALGHAAAAPRVTPNLHCLRRAGCPATLRLAIRTEAKAHGWVGAASAHAQLPKERSRGFQTLFPRRRKQCVVAWQRLFGAF